MGDVAKKALRQVHDSVASLVSEHLPKDDAERIATELSSGKWTHDYPIDCEEARGLGLKVRDDMPREIYELMDLYPQAGQRRPGVEFIPLPYGPQRPQLPPRGGRG